MKLKKILQMNWKKPELGQLDLVKEEKKLAVNLAMERAESRLESIGILTSHFKGEDAQVLVRAFLGDLLNAVKIFESQLEIKKEEIFNSLEELSKNVTPESQGLMAEFGKHKLLIELSLKESLSDENIEKLEFESYTLFSSLSAAFKNSIQNDLFTEMDHFNRISKIKKELGWVFLIFFLIVGIYTMSFIQRNYLYEIGNQEIQLFFVTQKFPDYQEDKSVYNKLDISEKGKWVDLSFKLHETQDALTGVRLDISNEPNVKVQLDYLKYLDQRGKVLWERNFEIQDNFLPADYDKLSGLNEVKPGKIKPGESLEMITMGFDPYFSVTSPSIDGVTEVVVRYRFIDERKKFED
ncbi:hypothetical protein [Leptospira sp. GIMC2001]|uniref:hypothetical protein n=1 Tax=Leptospira sp. GIMC2001 TaxID=1513297 RepID=UPI00234A7EC3|nr:hypothetical protein [Leptospira sp. GIMC2001]WCL50556.1 hypothetical protein O4O04_06990 [Leptospira sp. GIMC2001]